MVKITRLNINKKVDEIDTSNIVDEDVKEVVTRLNEFDVNLALLNKNLRDLHIEYVDKMENTLNFAEYNLPFNYITTRAEGKRIGLAHEMLHVSSTYVTNNKIYTGFCQIGINKDNYIGAAFNEGYTCVIDNRYFLDMDKGKEKITSNSYALHQNLVKLIEIIVIKDRMEEMYFNADLKGLFEFLSSYMGEEYTLEFFENMDLIYKNFDCSKHPNLIYAAYYYKKCISYISNLLICYYTDLYKKNNISSKDYKECLVNIKYLVQGRVTFGKNKLIKSFNYSDKEFYHDVKVIKTLKKVH